ncbi:MAG: HNH endonuclease signature motif containing protein [Phycisphaerales bacterium]|nr:HNH endonuclease signature motif containing protein [Phycisphaerales bacterium]
MEAGYKCGNPTCRHILTMELHHIIWVKHGGRNETSNLLALCPNCHSLHTAGHIPEEAIRHWKGMLVALNHAFGFRSLDLLLFLRATQDKILWYSADGVLQFAGLVAGGLVAITEETVATPWQITQSSHRIALTEQGISLVQAWLDGNEQKFKATLKT